MIKGSDASNVHDEEVDVREMEFSDDEEERAHKKMITNTYVCPKVLSDHR